MTGKASSRVAAKTHSEEAFLLFAESGYDVSSIKKEDIHHVASEWVAQLVPVYPQATWEQQQARKSQWPWIFGLLVGRMYSEWFFTDQENRKLKESLIEARKEISRLKRCGNGPGA